MGFYAQQHPVVKNIYLFWTNYNSESIGIKTSEQHALYEFQRQLVKEGVGVILGGCDYVHI